MAGENDTNEEAEHGDPEFGDATVVPEPETQEVETPAEDETPETPPAEKTLAELKADLEESERVRKGLTRRVGTLSAEKRDISKKLQERIAAVPQPQPDPVIEGEEPVRSDFKTKAEFDAAVTAEADRVATQRIAVQEWTNKCNDVEDKGSKAFGAKWKAAKDSLAILDDDGRIPLALLSTALETDNPAQVLFELGGNIDLASDMMAMTPLKRAIAMDRLAQKKPTERQRSNAPAPIDPITGRGGGNDAPSDRDSDAEWHRKEGLREAALRKKKLGLA